MSFASGTVVGQKLRLERMLAKGGMGSVWIAEHLGLKTRVAVKFIDDALDADASILSRFEREAAAIAQIRSPHIVQILDHGFIEERIPFIVMELLEGESLGQRLRRVSRLSPQETVVVIGQACRALSKAHSMSIVHRDIKPDNIFLIDSDGDLFVKVLDFGIAKRLQDETISGATQTGVVIGTPQYMSPEQLLSARSVAPATDLWAMAAVAYVALTGEQPFSGETFAGLCLAISAGRFTPATERCPDLPPGVDEWFRRGFQVDPAARFGAARELSEALARALGIASLQISVPSALPAPSDDPPREARPSSSSGERTGTAAIPWATPAPTPAPNATLPSTDTNGRAKAAQALSNASLAAASMPSGVAKPGTSRTTWIAAGAAAVALAVIALVVMRRDPPVTVAHPANPEVLSATTAPTQIPTVAPPPPTAALPPQPEPAPSSQELPQPTAQPTQPKPTLGTSIKPVVGHLPHPPPHASSQAHPVTPTPPPPPKEHDHGF